MKSKPFAMEIEMKKHADLDQVPTLAKPGAGIGFAEMLFLKWYVLPFNMSGLDKIEALKSLNEGHRSIAEQISAFKQDDLTKRVLVKRPNFVEDSSRYWSAAMLCNHIGKVNGALAKAIESGFIAKAGLEYNPQDRLKAVKPELEKNDLQELDVFQQSVERIRKAVQIQSEINLNSRQVPHPWFGNLTHLQWVWFAGFHMKIHAKQLEQIILGLR